MEPAPPSGPSAPVRLFDGGWRAQAFFLFLALVLCGPLLSPPLGFPASAMLADPGKAHWNFWWVDQVVRGQAPPGSSLRFSPLIFHPLGADLSYHTLEVSYAVALLPVRWLFGPLAQHNAALVLASWLTAWSVWFAARSLGCGAWAAAAAAAAVSLHGYRLAEGIHLNLFGVWAFPFALGFLARLARAPDDLRAAAGLGIVYAACVFTSVFHAFACALAGVAWLAAVGWRWRRSPGRLAPLAKSLALAAALAAPAVAWLLWGMANAPTPARFGAEGQVRNAADAWQLLLHPRIRLALAGGDLMAHEELRLTMWYLPGYLLAAAGGWLLLRKAGRRGPWPWLGAAAAGYWILALGPWLKVGSPAEAFPDPTRIPLPGLLLGHVPGLGTLRSIWHFGFYGTVCAAIVGARGTEVFLASRPALPRAWLAPALVLAIAAGESFLRPVASFPVPGEWAGDAVAALAPPDAAIAAAPQLLYEVRGNFMAQQTRHGRPMLAGYIARDPAAWDRWRAQRLWPLELDEILVGRRAEFSPAARRHFRIDREEHRIALLMVYDLGEDSAVWRAADAWSDAMGLRGAVWQGDTHRLYDLRDRP